MSRPTPEDIEEIRRGLAAARCSYVGERCNSGRCEVHGGMALTIRCLLAEVDALTAERAAIVVEAIFRRAQTRVLAESLVYRVQTAEAALVRLREAAAAVESRVAYSDTSRVFYLMPAPGQPRLGLLREALSATPTDLADAQRREWMAQGLEEAAKMAGAYGREGDLDGKAYETDTADELAARFEKRAAELRGGR